VNKIVFVIISFSCLLTACVSVGPDYKKKDYPVSHSFASLEQGITTGENPGGQYLDSWWTVFHDPVLECLMERAVQKNTDLRIAAARVQQARAQAMVSSSALLPEGELRGSYQRIRRTEDPVSVRGLSSDGSSSSQDVTVSRDQDLYLTGFDASWEIDIFGGVRREIEAAYATLGAYQEDLRQTLITLQGEVALNYIDVRGLQLRLDIAGRQIKARRDYAEITEARAKAGLVSELDAARARGELATAEAIIPALERSLRAAVHRLGVLLGEEPASLQDQLLVSAPLPEIPGDLPVGLPADLLRRRPDIRRAERELAAATAQIGVSVAELFPKFSLTGSYGFQAGEGGKLLRDESNFWQIGPSVRWPLLNFRRRCAQIEVSKAIRDESLARYEQTVLLSFEEVENALVALSREKRRSQSLSESVSANDLAVKLALDRYLAGLQSFLVVIDAQAAFYSAEDQLAQSVENQAIAFISLYKALGGGWQEYSANEVK
jgi:NodT family efflux transporter outer membrane factor (OMF) lipoprotein